MGFYIQVPHKKNKVEQIIKLYGDKGAVEVTEQVANIAMSNPNEGVIVVVDNGQFEAAAFAFNQREFDDFVYDDSGRPMRFITMPRMLAEELSGF